MGIKYSRLKEMRPYVSPAEERRLRQAQWEQEQRESVLREGREILAAGEVEPTIWTHVQEMYAAVGLKEAPALQDPDEWLVRVNNGIGHHCENQRDGGMFTLADGKTPEQQAVMREVYRILYDKAERRHLRRTKCPPAPAETSNPRTELPGSPFLPADPAQQKNGDALRIVHSLLAPFTQATLVGRPPTDFYRLRECLARKSHLEVWPHSRFPRVWGFTFRTADHDFLTGWVYDTAVSSQTPPPPSDDLCFSKRGGSDPTVIAQYGTHYLILWSDKR